MSLQIDLAEQSSVGFFVDLGLASTLDAFPHAIRDLAMAGTITGPSFTVDLAAMSGVQAFAGNGPRRRSRRADTGISP